MPYFEKKSTMPISVKQLFSWHEKTGALERLTPPWENITVLRKDPSLKPGSEVHLKTRIGLLNITWVAKHVEYIQDTKFTDIQLKGPFAYWKHSHCMTPKGESLSVLTDKINYKLRFGLGKGIAKQSIERLFNYRHRVLKNDLEVQKNYPSPPLTIAITGASGLVGKELTAFLLTAGHRVLPIVRKPANKSEIFWDLESGTIDKDKLEEVDAVIHLAGENIGSGRWTKQKKQRIRDSRINGTKILVDTLNSLKSPPKVLISTSAIGYYGSHYGSGADESKKAGEDFLAKVCFDWEQEAKKFKKGRLVIPRFGVVLTPKGGALQKMLLPFKLGIGGKMGSGKQLMSWIAIDDLVYNLYRLLVDQQFSGAINLTAPSPVSNQEFSKTLAKTLCRPSIFPLPAVIPRLLFGEMADSIILSDIEAIPSVLNKAGVSNYYPELSSALRHLLGK